MKRFLILALLAVMCPLPAVLVAAVVMVLWSLEQIRRRRGAGPLVRTTRRERAAYDAHLRQVEEDLIGGNQP